MMQKQQEINTLQEIDSFFARKKFLKGTVLVHQGKKSRYGYHVITGCLKSFVIDNNGKEHIVQFAPENWLIADMNSFLNGALSAVNIDVIEDSEVIVYDRRAIDYFEKMPQELLLGEVRRLQNNIITHHNRIIALLSATAEERYVSFMETYPSLCQRLSLKLIASYLGITPEFLSRIRKKIAEK